MVPYHERTFRAMAENNAEEHVARIVLVWVAASSRNLYIPELSNALKLDINTVLPSAKSAVEGLRGQLIFVDHQSGMISLVHTTVHEFLLSESAGEFYISKPRAHERIALTCLKLFSNGEMKPPRSPRMLSEARKNQELSPLVNYANTQMSEHVYSASAETDEILLVLDPFSQNERPIVDRKGRSDGQSVCLNQAIEELEGLSGQKSQVYITTQ